MDTNRALIIYNLYPKLVGRMDRWVGQLDRIRSMGFTWVYVNPVHAPGFSGSDYAVKNHFLYHPMFTCGWPPEGEDYSDESLGKTREQGDAMLADVCRAAHDRKLDMMMDLVINHTAIDAHLVTAKPQWYKHNADGSIQHPGAFSGNEWVEWGDLAEIDNENSPDRDELWQYWLDVVLHYCRLGVRGFRCDAAYHVPNALWQFIISRAREAFPDVLFIAETLGCTPAQLISIGDAGFDYVMNSFKWWNLKDEWFLKDYATWVGKYPSVTFPENHDTERYAEEVNGNAALAIAKYALGSFFCAGIVTTMGFEYGFHKKIDVVQTNPNWWEPAHYDISDTLARINEIKSSYQILREDDMISMQELHVHGAAAFTKLSRDGHEKIFVIANMSTEHRHVVVPNMHEIMRTDQVQDLSHGHRMGAVPHYFEYELQPGEVKLLYSNPGYAE